MSQKRETFFRRIRQWKDNSSIVSDGIVIFRAASEALSGYLVSPMLSDAFCILAVKQGSVSLSVNYTEARISMDSMFFFTPRMVISFRDASEDLVVEGVCFSPAYCDSMSSHAAVYGRMISFLGENTMPVFTKDRDASGYFSGMHSCCISPTSYCSRHRNPCILPNHRKMKRYRTSWKSTVHSGNFSQKITQRSTTLPSMPGSSISPLHTSPGSCGASPGAR